MRDEGQKRTWKHGQSKTPWKPFSMLLSQSPSHATISACAEDWMEKYFGADAKQHTT